MSKPLLYEEVSAATEELLKANQKITIKNIKEKMGKGSSRNIRPLLNKWMEAHPEYGLKTPVAKKEKEQGSQAYALLDEHKALAFDYYQTKEEVKILQGKLAELSSQPREKALDLASIGNILSIIAEQERSQATQVNDLKAKVSVLEAQKAELESQNNQLKETFDELQKQCSQHREEKNTLEEKVKGLENKLQEVRKEADEAKGKALAFEKMFFAKAESQSKVNQEREAIDSTAEPCV